MVVLNRGDAAGAVRASCGGRGLYAPVRNRGRLQLGLDSREWLAQAGEKATRDRIAETRAVLARTDAPAAKAPQRGV